MTKLTGYYPRFLLTPILSLTSITASILATNRHRSTRLLRKTACGAYPSPRGAVPVLFMHKALLAPGAARAISRKLDALPADDPSASRAVPRSKVPNF
ncbi:hypothetical protein EJ06DRAFT_288085 [Trichodelitschia bisporula]|uniref:Uncharacterized protein n=1 Tax=Trichodelitschia bisporula TaxID=703511 RepID=A0A6G1I6L5_9PEZI|nr:hypothetical protein EJ06DRAFT_288085 [Trichodelitschia bisporula]